MLTKKGMRKQGKNQQKSSEETGRRTAEGEMKCRRKRREDREKKEEQKRSADADEGRARVQERQNGTIGAITGRINSQLKRSEDRGKKEPAEEERIMLREKNSRVDELPQQQQEIKQTERRRGRWRIGKEE